MASQSENQFESDCEKAFDELFQAALKNGGEQKFDLCLRHLVRLKSNQGVMDYSLSQRVFHNIHILRIGIDSLIQRRSDEYDDDLIIILKLFSFMQCLEIRFLYKVIGNLLRVIKCEDPISDLYDHISKQPGVYCYNDIMGLFNDSTLARFSLPRLWEKFVDFSLRNAIGHSDFIIIKAHQEISIPYQYLKPITNLNIKAGEPSYKLNKIDDLYIMANEFVNAFITVYNRYQT